MSAAPDIVLSVSVPCRSIGVVLFTAAALGAPAEKAVAQFSGPPSGPPCSGNACSNIKLEQRGSCVWARNDSNLPVTFETQIGGQPLKVFIEAPDEKKAAARKAAMDKPQADRQTPQRKGSSSGENCDRALRSIKLLEQTGRPEFITGDMRRAAQACEQQTVVDEASYHEPVYQAFIQAYRGAAFWTRLTAPNGCVAAIGDIRAYKATLVGEVPVKVEAQVPMPCKGNACTDLIYDAERCEIRNAGKKPMAVKVVAKEFTYTTTIPALSPGGSTASRGFSGCLRPAGMASIEANY